MFEPSPQHPLLRQEPIEVAHETFLIRATQPSLGGALSTSLNSVVIRCAEPVIIDTGMVTNRATWREDVFSLVDPTDVRWIFVSHADDDHVGNLPEALDLCPNATFVANWGLVGRLSASLGIPLDRIRAVDHGGTLDVGDRTLRAIRPPVYDSPHTRGLFDPQTRAYYAVDAFCAPMPADPVDSVTDMPEAMWQQGMTMFHHGALAPWLSMIDPSKFQAAVKDLEDLRPQLLIGAHTPLIPQDAVQHALEMLAHLPSTSPLPLDTAGASLLVDSRGALP